MGRLLNEKVQQILLKGRVPFGRKGAEFRVADSAASAYRRRMHPILLFDGDCAFCTASVNFLTRYIRPQAQIIPWQRADLGTLGVSERECQESIQWFAAPGARPLTQGRAVAAALRCGWGLWPLVGRVMQLPGIIQVMNAAYRLVAANRFRLPGATPACRVPSPGTSAASASSIAPNPAPKASDTTSSPTSAHASAATSSEAHAASTSA